MSQDSAIIIKKFCEEDTFQNLSYWDRRYLEDPKATLEAIRTFRDSRCMCLNYSIRALAALSICSFLAGLGLILWSHTMPF